MSQLEVWDREYRNPTFLSNSNEPQLDFKHFVKWLRKERKVNLDGLRVLDLGSGTGKNSIFLAERGCIVTGIELSPAAIELAKARSQHSIEWIQGSIGEKLPFADQTFDLILDIVSSNSLSQKERNVYSAEIERVLKPGGYLYVKALCLDGDKNANNLLQQHPGKEKNTYVMPNTGIVERVFSKEEMQDLYKHFTLIKLERKSSYTFMNGRNFKRNFWLLSAMK